MSVPISTLREFIEVSSQYIHSIFPLTPPQDRNIKGCNPTMQTDADINCFSCEEWRHSSFPADCFSSNPSVDERGMWRGCPGKQFTFHNLHSYKSHPSPTNIVVVHGNSDTRVGHKGKLWQKTKPHRNLGKSSVVDDNPACRSSGGPCCHWVWIRNWRWLARGESPVWPHLTKKRANQLEGGSKQIRISSSKHVDAFIKKCGSL